jgi:hypothetical protein
MNDEWRNELIFNLLRHLSFIIHHSSFIIIQYTSSLEGAAKSP